MQRYFRAPGACVLVDDGVRMRIGRRSIRLRRPQAGDLPSRVACSVTRRWPIRSCFSAGALAATFLSIASCQGSQDAATGPATPLADAGPDAPGKVGGSGSEAGATGATDGAPGSDATVSASDAAILDASEKDATPADAGAFDASCADGSARCAAGCTAGYHTCAQGCCAFGTTPILTPGTKDSIEAIAATVAPDGTIHVLYLDATKEYVVHTFGKGASVTAEGVAVGGGMRGLLSIALDGTGAPVVSYATVNAVSGAWSVDAQRRVGGAWSAISVVAGSDELHLLQATLTGIDATGAWGIFHRAAGYAPQPDTLAYQTSTDGGTWSTSQALAPATWRGFGFDAHAVPYELGWVDTTSTSFYVAQPSGGVWASRSFTAPISDPLQGVTAAVDPSGNPVFATGGGAMVYRYAAGAWSSEATPIATQVAAPLLAVDGAGNPTLAAWSGGYVQIARRTAGGWETGIIGPTPTSMYPVYALALGPAGEPVACWVPYGTSSDPDDSVACSTW